jgi:hypothetical protein
MAYEANVVAFA